MNNNPNSATSTPPTSLTYDPVKWEVVVNGKSEGTIEYNDNGVDYSYEVQCGWNLFDRFKSLQDAQAFILDHYTRCAYTT